MADDRISSPTSPDPLPETPPRRRVYESTLFPKRKRRRFSPWVVIPLILLVCVGIFGYLQYAAHRVRFVDTAGQVVFASDQGTPGIPHLWIAHGDGSGARRLTSGAASDTAPDFAPNGSQIAFLSDRESRQNQIFVVDADGQNLMQATRNAGAKSQPAWAPGAAGLLGYTAGGALSTLSISSTGPGDADRLLPPPPSAQHAPGADEALSSQAATVTVPTYAWSPAKDAGLAAVEDTGSFQALAVFSSLSTGPRDVQSSPQGGAQSGVPLAAADTLTLGWSPDGSLLAVAMLGIKGLPTPASGILLFTKDGDSAGGRPPLLVRGATDGPQDPVFSPDGTQILFERWSQLDLARRRCLGLFLVPTDGTGPPRLVFKGTASEAQFAPDGSAIFFLAGRPGGGHDLCRVAPDGTGFVRLSDGHADVSGLSVSPQQPKP